MTTPSPCLQRLSYVWLSILLLTFSNATAQQSVKSPDGKLSVSVTLKDQVLTYTVEKAGIQVISPSALGISTSVADFTSGLKVVSSQVTSVNDTYTLPSGKKSEYKDNCNVLTIRLSKGGKAMHVIFRAYNDGFAYRYHIPGSSALTVNNETSAIVINNFDKSWAMKYKNSYEEYFPMRSWAATSSIATYCAPVLVKNSNGMYCLITEAANYGNYCVSKIKAGTQTGLFTLEQTGAISTTAPLSTPWRAVIVGDLTSLVESVMIENLNPKTEMTDMSWIKPGRASWDWGGEEGSTNATFERSKRYIDLAASMNWEYFMLDEGWDKSGFGATLKEVVEYGKSKGVDILLWSHHNRFKNDEKQIRPILEDWKNQGIKGVKVDFWEDDAQPMIQKYDKLTAIAAELKLLVNVHGCTKPSGTRRRWPHFLTSEGVYGGEQYLFNPRATPARHNVTLAFTRNVIGSMDYTPADFADKKGVLKKLTTMSHQVALTVVYESGILHMNDSPINYENHVSSSFLKIVPAAWDDTKCLEASPDQYITVARRKGDEWYVGSICDDARTVNLDLSFLKSGVTYYANIYKDGSIDTDLVLDQQKVTGGQKLSIPLRAHGGVSIYFSTKQFAMPVVTTFEAEALENKIELTDVTPDENCSGGQFAANLGGEDVARTLTFKNVNVPTAGNYIMTVYYMTGQDRKMSHQVNDQPPVEYAYTGTGSWDGFKMGSHTFVVNLKAGANEIKFGNLVSKTWCPNIDRITITSIP
jgi:alpha-glucosidase